MRWIIVSSLCLFACNRGDGSSDGDTGGDTDPGDGVAQFGDGLPEFEVIGTVDDGLSVPRDLAFNPYFPEQLWVVNRETDSTTIFFDPATDEQRSETRQDVYGNHFMEEVSSIAFGADNTFGTCHESRNTYDGQQRANDFMGPALWDADLDVYSNVNQSNRLLGSHIDMLHESPMCMGIAWSHDNVYWVFDGYNGDVVYYDFQEDHGPGHDDHSDGIVRRYGDVDVTRVPDVPGHLVLDPATGWLYVADTGTGRVFRMDTATGEKTDDLPEEMEPLEEYSLYEGAVVEDFATGLSQPSGIALHGDRLFVSDFGTNEIIAYDLDGNELARLEVEADGIMGITVGPDEKLWYVDGVGETVRRIDP